MNQLLILSNSCDRCIKKYNLDDGLEFQKYHTQFQNLGHDRSMRILYFTDGAGIDLSGIRGSLLRIPEVLTSIRRGQEQARYVDLMHAMSLSDNEFAQIPTVLRTLLINLVQRGLHQRWTNRDYRADLILRRINHRSFIEVQSEILKFVFAKKNGSSDVAVKDLQLLHFLEQIEITIIGPGYDQIEMWLRKVVSSHTGIKIKIKDVIATDPQLEWFWPQVKDSVFSDQNLLS